LLFFLSFLVPAFMIRAHPGVSLLSAYFSLHVSFSTLSAKSLVLAVVPQRFVGTPTDPLTLALSLLAALPPTRWGSPTLTVPVLADRIKTPVFLPMGVLPIGSWAAFSQTEWTGHIDAAITFDTQPLRLLFPRPETWDSQNTFFLPRLSCAPLGQSTAAVAWDDPLWDSTAVGFLLGGLQHALPLAFSSSSVGATLTSPLLRLLLVTAGRAYKPWLGNPLLPRKGYGARPFPLTASVEKSLNGLSLALQDTPQNDHRGFLNDLVRMRILIPNAPYAPTAWVQGPNWQSALDRFPAALIEAGAAVAASLPTPLPALPDTVLYDHLFEGSAHDVMAQAALVTNPVLLAQSLFPAFARGRR
jgi:hypothetical protein